MKEIFNDGLKLFARVVVSNLLSFFVVISVITLALSVFPNELGYMAYGTKDDNTELLYTYYFADGDDTKFKEYEEMGYEISTKEIKEIQDDKNTVCLAVAQFFALGILVSFIYSPLWQKGYKDRNLAQIGSIPHDPLKGLKMGILATIPAFVLILVFAFCKNSTVALFKILNATYYPLIELIAGSTLNFSELEPLKIILIALIFLIVPAVSFMAYYLGNKDFSIIEKVTYKKIKREF